MTTLEFEYQPRDADRSLVYHIAPSLEDFRRSLASFGSTHSTIVVVWDRDLPPEYADRVLMSFEQSRVVPVSILPIEKTLAKVETVWAAMNAERGDLAVSVGGGSISDVVGLAASTFQRGIPRIIVPTTVMALIDASIGGKTGIDYGGVKNSVGSIHYASLVVAFTPFLDSLPQEQFASGLAEMVKAGVLYNRHLFEYFESGVVGVGVQPSSVPPEVYLESARTKASVCSEPRHDKRSLLYGHAVGHALEALGHGLYSHGTSVAIGMHLEGSIAVELGLFDRQDWERQARVLAGLDLLAPLEACPFSTGEVVEQMYRYRRLVNGSQLLLALPRGIGEFGDSSWDCLIEIDSPTLEHLLRSHLK